MGRPASRRWPLEPLLAAAHTTSLATFADAVGVDRREVYRWRAAGGVTTEMSDRLAVLLGHTPCELWPEWLDDAIEAANRLEQERREDRLARNRTAVARYRQRHPDRVARHQAEQRERPEMRDYKRRYAQSYRRRNRDRVLAQQRTRRTRKAA